MVGGSAVSAETAHKDNAVNPRGNVFAKVQEGVTCRSGTIPVANERIAQDAEAQKLWEDLKNRLNFIEVRG